MIFAAIFFGDVRLQRKMPVLHRSHVRQVDIALPHRHAVLQRRPMQREMPEAPAVAPVAHDVAAGHRPQPVLLRHDGDRRLAVGNLPRGGLGRQVRQYHAVGAHEGHPVGAALAEIAAVAPAHGVAVGVTHRQRLVLPVPHEAALEAGEPLHGLPVFGEVAAGVRHLVGVLHLNQRPGIGGIGKCLLNLAVPPVHRADDVGDRFVAVAAFILHQPRRVGPADPPGHRRVVRPQAGLVAQRPEQDAGVVAVGQHHAGRPVQERVGPLRVHRETPLYAVGLQVGLADQQDTQLVAEVVPARVIGVVAGAHGVEVEALHQNDFPPHVPDGHSAAGFHREFMPVHPAHDEPVAVQAHHAVHDLDPAEPDGAALVVHLPPIGVEQRKRRPVEGRAVGIPRGDLRQLDEEVRRAGLGGPLLGNAHGAGGCPVHRAGRGGPGGLLGAKGAVGAPEPQPHGAVGVAVHLPQIDHRGELACGALRHRYPLHVGIEYREFRLGDEPNRPVEA